LEKQTIQTIMRISNKRGLELCLFSLLLVSINGISQELDWHASISAEGLFSSEDNNPFWFSANSFRQRGSESDFSGLITGDLSYELSEKSRLEAGVAAFYRNGVEDEFQRRDLFVAFENNWLRAVVGAQYRPIRYRGISLTNRDFLNSGNARPLGGFLLEAPKMLRLSKNFGMDWGLGHYHLNDERYVKDTWVHYKRLALNYNFYEKHNVLFQVKHYAQWAGTSPVYGDLNDDFEAFVDVFFARRAPEINEEGEALNAVGNHLGTYLLSYSYSHDAGNFEFYHEHPYEDGSGTRLANFPDGTWGTSYFWNDHRFLEGLVYEFVYTLDQSNSTTFGRDNYFNNNIYRSGWSYEQQIIGMPLMVYDPTIEITETTSPIVSNRVRAHHFGFIGHIGLVQWTYKSTIVDQLGTFGAPNNASFWYNYVEASYGTFFGELTFKFGVDTGNRIDTTVGGGLQYSYSF